MNGLLLLLFLVYTHDMDDIMASHIGASTVCW